MTVPALQRHDGLQLSGPNDGPCCFLCRLRIADDDKTAWAIAFFGSQ